jgi:hypothetical protein
MGEMTKTNNGGQVTKASGNEIAGAMSTALSAAAVQEIQGAMMIAKQFPRDEDLSRQMVLRSCSIPVFAEMCIYKYPIGGKEITGITVNLAKEMARCLGDFRFGSYTVSESSEQRVIRCWAWDLQSRVKAESDVPFMKMVFRKDSRGDGSWRPCDERELLALNNNHRARGIRNCILELIGPELKDAAMAAVYHTLETAAAKDPKAALRNLVDGFGGMGVRPDEIRDFAGTDLEKLTPKQITYLGTVLAGLKEGIPWSDFLSKLADQKGVGEGPVSNAAELRERINAKVAEAKKPKKKDGQQTKPTTEEEPPRQQSDADEGPSTAAKSPSEETKAPARQPVPYTDDSDGIQ